MSCSKAFICIDQIIHESNVVCCKISFHFCVAGVTGQSHKLKSRFINSMGFKDTVRARIDECIFNYHQFISLLLITRPYWSVCLLCVYGAREWKVRKDLMLSCKTQQEVNQLYFFRIN